MNQISAQFQFTSPRREYVTAPVHSYVDVGPIKMYDVIHEPFTIADQPGQAHLVPIGP